MTERTSRSPLVILICGTAIVMIVMGVRMTYGVWMRPASSEFGWGLQELSFAMALQALLWGLGTPVAGWIADRYGAGRVLAFGGILFTLGLFLMAFAQSPLEATLTVGVLTGFAMSACTFPIILSAISQAVDDEKKRALYQGIASSAGSSGQFIVLPIAYGVMDAHGWVTTLFMLAAITGLVVPLAAGLAGSRPASAGAQANKQNLGEVMREAGGHRGYWLLNFGYFVCGFQTLFIVTHFPGMIGDQGILPEMGAWAIALIGLFNIFGCFFWSIMGGRRRKKYLLCWLYSLRSVIMAAFILLPISELSVAIFASAMGLLWLGTIPLTGQIIAQIFGLRYMATLFGFTFLWHQIGSAIGIMAGGMMYDYYGNYDVIWWSAIALGGAASLLNYPIDDRPIVRKAVPAAA